MPKVLFATCAALPDGDEDQPLLERALGDLGLEARVGVWSDPAVEWGTAELVVVRSTWDYTEDLDGFLAWAASIPHLANSATVLRWNTDKHYLDDLARSGVPTIPTTYASNPAELAIPDAPRFVIKPTVGAGSKGAARFDASDVAAAEDHLASLLAQGVAAMVQPYLEEVEVSGETAVIMIDAEVSHAIEKGAMLVGGPLDPSGLYRRERIRHRTASDAELEVAERTLTAATVHLGLTRPPLFARVDLLGTPSGPSVLELELTEPSLFLGHDERAPGRLAAAIARWCGDPLI